MAFGVSHLTSLKSNKIQVTPEPREGAFIAGSSFNLSLIIFNAGSQPVAWSAENPLHISYRWINEAGECVEREGLRTSIPCPLAPKTELPVTLRGRTQEEPGNYRLQPSLVLEGVHWACDIDALGWAELNVQVLSRPAWPQDLKDSVGGRALRGALARAGLARSLAGNIPGPKFQQEAYFSVDQSPEATLPAPDAETRKVSRTSRFRNWVRRTLGIQNVQRDLERVANAVTRQEQRSAELHQYLERLEIMLGEGLSGLRSDVKDIAGPLRKEHIFNHLTALEVNRSLAAIQDELQLQSTNSQQSVSGQGSTYNRHRSPSKLPDETQTRDGG